MVLDYKRHCHYSYMSLWRDGVHELVYGRWFRATPGAKVLTDMSYFRAWKTWGRGEPDAAIGEQTHLDTPYYKGQNESHLPGLRYCGSLEAITGGGRTGTDPPIALDAQGTAECCFKDFIVNPCIASGVSVPATLYVHTQGISFCACMNGKTFRIDYSPAVGGWLGGPYLTTCTGCLYGTCSIRFGIQCQNPAAGYFGLRLISESVESGNSHVEAPAVGSTIDPVRLIYAENGTGTVGFICGSFSAVVDDIPGPAGELVLHAPAAGRRIALPVSQVLQRRTP